MHRRINVWWGIVLIGVIATGLLLSSYSKVKVGMTEQEVVAIMGPGELYLTSVGVWHRTYGETIVSFRGNHRDGEAWRISEDKAYILSLPRPRSLGPDPHPPTPSPRENDWMRPQPK